MLFYESNRGDTAGLTFFGYGNHRFLLLVVKLVHNRGECAALLFQNVTQGSVYIVFIYEFIVINIGKYVVENVVDIVGMSFKQVVGKRCSFG